MKILVAGAAVALASGMMLGDAMKPILWSKDQPLFSSETVAWGASDSDQAANITTYYKGATPDYVIGTDWLAGAYQPLHVQPPETRAPDPPRESYVSAADDEPTHAETTYPSQDGDILAGVRLLPPPSDEEAPAPPV